MSQLSGKTILVTGATSGIGYYTALELARRGGLVVLSGRSQARGQQAADNIRREVSNAQVDVLSGDFSVMDQVRRVGNEFKQRYSRLDVLVNNAGGFFMRRQLSTDGYEKTFALNHLSYFLLTNLLLDTIRASAPARIVNVASTSHRDAQMHFDDLGLEHGYGFGLRAYGQSKLANVLFTYELDRRLTGSGVTVNALHPGFVRTGLPTKHTPVPLRLFVALSFLFGMPPQEGARTSVMLAADPELEGVSGKYFSVGKPVRSSPRSYDQQSAERLWEISEQMTGIVPTG